MASAEKVFIIGIGDDGLVGLTQASRGILEHADVVMGPASTLSAVHGLMARRIEIGSDLDEIVRTISQHHGKHIAVLTVGDPLFYGTARYLCDRLGKDRFEVVPHVSSMQLAFARVKESWDEAYLTNLATQSLDRVVDKVRTSEKAGIFTTDEASPAAVAQALLERGIDYFTAYVCENLGSPDERVTQGELAEVAEQEFGPLNVMILVRKPNVPDRPASMAGTRLFGNTDDAFLQSQPKRGLLTSAEVRAVALAELDLGPNSVVWDVGAGSGSVAIEAARLSANGQVFAIERDPEDYQLIAQNAERFGVTNLTPVLGQAPEAWHSLPEPDAIFVGGTGRAVAGIVELAFQRLRRGGRLVANVSSLDNVVAVRDVLRGHGQEAVVRMINLARGMEQMETLRFESLHPTFLISTAKET